MPHRITPAQEPAIRRQAEETLACLGAELTDDLARLISAAAALEGISTGAWIKQALLQQAEADLLAGQEDAARALRP